MSWHSVPRSNKQKDLILKLSPNTEVPKTKGECRDLIEKLLMKKSEQKDPS
jgi:hypothetical protein